MPIYRLSAKVISRSSGRTSVGAAAYRAGEKLNEEVNIFRTFDYSNKIGVLHTEILFPEGIKLMDRQTLWNEVERSENRKDSQLAREIQLALPKELSDEDNIKLVREYVKSNFVALGMIADIAIHNVDKNNPHAHVMLTTRNITQEGFGKKNRDWNSRELIEEWRKNWAEDVNNYLANAGIDERIDHRSNKDRGIELIPAKNHGTDKNKLSEEFKREVSEKLKYSDNLFYAKELEELIGLDDEEKEVAYIINKEPRRLIDYLTKNKTIFSEKELDKYLDKISIDKEQANKLKTLVLADNELLELPSDNNERQFTSKIIFKSEVDTIVLSTKLAKLDSKIQLKERLKTNILSKYEFSEEQKEVFNYIADNKQFIVINGIAGAGKSYVLGSVVEAHQEAGYNIVGLSSTGKSAEVLEKATSIKSRTIASFLKADQAIDDKTMLIVDEASLIGVTDMAKLLKKADISGAKLVLVGDTRQLSSVSAGNAFASVLTHNEYKDITEVRRQSNALHRDATKALAEGRTSEAMSIYNKEGAIVVMDTVDEAKDRLLTKWLDDKLANNEERSVMLAFNRTNVESLNATAHNALKQYQVLGANRVEVETADFSKLEICEKEQITFTKNDKDLGVKNGTQGMVKTITQDTITVETEDKRIIELRTNDKLNINYYYASTIHKSQGITCDKSYVLLTKGMDNKSAYVALTRHKEAVNIYWSKDNFDNGKEVSEVLNNARKTSTALELLKSSIDKKNVFSKEELFVDTVEKLIDKANEYLAINESDSDNTYDIKLVSPERKVAKDQLVEDFERDLKASVKYSSNEYYQVINTYELIGLAQEHSRYLAEKSRLNANAYIINKEPRRLIDYLTKNKTIFSEKELDKYLDKISIDKEQANKLKTLVLADNELLELPSDNNERQFTSKIIFKSEVDTIVLSTKLAKLDSKIQLKERLKTNILSKYEFSEEQKEVFNYIADNKQFIVINGIAGAGKSYVLGSVVEAHQEAGYNIVGLSSTGKSAEVLEKATSIKSRTIASFLKADQAIDDKTMLIVDEASLIGVTDMAKLLKKADISGAKLVLVGDTRQLSSVSAGNAFASVLTHNEYKDITEVRRQSNALHRDATKALAEGRTSEAMSIYNKEGAIVVMDTVDEAKDRLLTKWLDDKLANNEERSVMLAFNRTNVESLNATAHNALKQYQVLGANRVEVETADFSKLEICEKEQITFTKNDKDLGVKNGTQGMVKTITQDTITVETEDKRIIELRTNDKLNINYYYASTIHKSQGITCDKSYVLLTKGMDNKSAYVALTRHKEAVNIYWSKDNFDNGKEVSEVLNNARKTSTALELLKVDNARYKSVDINEMIYSVSQAVKAVELKKQIESAQIVREAVASPSVGQ